MSFHKQPVTVAIADVDSDRRAKHERFLQGYMGITVLTNSASSNKVNDDGHAFVDRRLKPRKKIEENANEVARIKRLNPLVLLVNLNLCTDEDYALLLSLRNECPDVLMVLLTDDSVREDQMQKIIEIGARGYLKYESVQLHLSKAIQVVSRGEAWVPRKMMGNMMNRLLS